MASETWHCRARLRTSAKLLVLARTSYPARKLGAVHHHVSRTWDDVDCECDEQRPHCGVDGPEEREDDGKEPHRQHDRYSCQCLEQQASGCVYTEDLLPDEKHRGNGKSECDELLWAHDKSGTGKQSVIRAGRRIHPSHPPPIGILMRSPFTQEKVQLLSHLV